MGKCSGHVKVHRGKCPTPALSVPTCKVSKVSEILPCCISLCHDYALLGANAKGAAILLFCTLTLVCMFASYHCSNVILKRWYFEYLHKCICSKEMYALLVCCMVQEPNQTLLPLQSLLLKIQIIKNLFSPHCMTNKLHMLHGSCTFQISVGLIGFL